METASWPVVSFIFGPGPISIFFGGAYSDIIIFLPSFFLVS